MTCIRCQGQARRCHHCVSASGLRIHHCFCRDTVRAVATSFPRSLADVPREPLHEALRLLSGRPAMRVDGIQPSASRLIAVPFNMPTDMLKDGAGVGALESAAKDIIDVILDRMYHHDRYSMSCNNSANPLFFITTSCGTCCHTASLQQRRGPFLPATNSSWYGSTFVLIWFPPIRLVSRPATLSLTLRATIGRGMNCCTWPTKAPPRPP